MLPRGTVEVTRVWKRFRADRGRWLLRDRVPRLGSLLQRGERTRWRRALCGVLLLDEVLAVATWRSGRSARTVRGRGPELPPRGVRTSSFLVAAVEGLAMSPGVAGARPDGPEPFITVVIPVRDGRKTLGRALASLLGQTFAGYEVVVVDDGSTDGSAELVRSLGDPRFRVIRRARPGGGRGRNRGIGCARGRFVTFLDADDEALPRWLETFAALAAEGAWVLRCGAILLGPDGMVRDVAFPSDPETLGGWLQGFLPGTYAVRRELLADLGGFDGGLRFGEHTELAFRLHAALGSGREVAVAPLLLIRRHWSGGDARYGAARTAWMLARAWASQPFAPRRLGRTIAMAVSVRRVNALVGGRALHPLPPSRAPEPGSAPTARRFPPSMVSVVIPVRDGARTLGRQLAALARQTYRGAWEVIIADNGSRDGLRAVVEEHAPNLPRVRVVDAGPVAGVSRARNAGARAAEGELILVCDADDEASPGWIEGMVRAAARHDLVGGPLETARLNPEGLREAHSVGRGGLWSDDPLPWICGANCAVWREVWAAVGGWDGSFRGGSDDVDFSWRVQLAGFTVGEAPDAPMHYAFRRGAVANLRQAFGYARAAARLYRRYRPAGMRARPPGLVVKSWAWTVLHLLDAVGPDPARTFWVRHVGRQLGRLVGSVQQRVFYL